jgi:maltose alpha-D-glucosyltransferase/alpha-amylase
VDLGEAAPRAVLAHQAVGESGRVLFVHNLGEQEVEVDLSAVASRAVTVLSDEGVSAEEPDLARVRLGAYAYRWLRVSGLPG